MQLGKNMVKRTINGKQVLMELTFFRFARLFVSGDLS